MVIDSFRNIFLAILLLVAFPILAQDGSVDEGKVKKTAKKHFKKGEYSLAEKLYGQLVIVDPSNAHYSFKFGACLVENNGDIATAIKHLKKGADGTEDNFLAYYYLGVAYQNDFQFVKAKKQFENYESVASKQNREKRGIGKKILQCKSSQQLIQNLKPLKVVATKTIKRKDFYRGYNLSSRKNKILVKPFDLKSKEDDQSKNKDPLLILQNAKSKKLVFPITTYGKRFAILQRDLFMTEKQGTFFSSNLDVGPLLNTDYEDDFPALSPDGLTLYFASKGHGGFGGYDIFQSRYDIATGLWGKPENMGFPINSPADDFMYVIDEGTGQALFASNRSTSPEEVMIYRIQSNQLLDNYVLYKGKIDGIDFEDVENVTLKVRDLDGGFISDQQIKKNTEFTFLLPELQVSSVEIWMDGNMTSALSMRAPYKENHPLVNFIITLSKNGSKAKLKEEPQKNLETKSLRSILLSMSDLKVNQSPEDAAKMAPTVDDPKIVVNKNEFKKSYLQVRKSSIPEDRKTLARMFNVAYLELKKENKIAKSLLKKVSLDDSTANENYRKSLDKIVALLKISKYADQRMKLMKKEENIIDGLNIESSASEAIESKKLGTLYKKHPDYLFPIESYAGSKLFSAKRNRSNLSDSVKTESSSVFLLTDMISINTELLYKTKKEEERAVIAKDIDKMEKASTRKKASLSKIEAELSVVNNELRQMVDFQDNFNEVYNRTQKRKYKELKGDDYSDIFNISKKTLENGGLLQSIYGISGQEYLSVLEHIQSQNLFADGQGDFNEGDDLDSPEDQYSSTTDLALSNQVEDLLGINNLNFDELNNPDLKNSFRKAVQLKLQIEELKKKLASTSDPDEIAALEQQIKELELEVYAIEKEGISAVIANQMLKISKLQDQINSLSSSSNVSNEQKTIIQGTIQAFDNIQSLEVSRQNTNSDKQSVELGKKLLAKQQSLIGIQEDFINSFSTPSFVGATSTTDNPYNKKYGYNNTMRLQEGMEVGGTYSYNEKTIIPIGIDLPSGLTFRIQIGAFRNKVSAEIFNGIAPLSGEKTSMGFTRYTVGLFKSLDACQIAKGKIVEMGYADAFIVVFLNGKRISLAKAKNIINGASGQELTTYNNNKNKEVSSLDKSGIPPSYAKVTRPKKQSPIAVYSRKKKSRAAARNRGNQSSSNNGGISSSVPSGLIYTVQVGAFQQRKSVSWFSSLQRKVWTVKQGSINKYYSGSFSSLEDAQKYRELAIQSGYNGAFVVAFDQRQRISVQEAQLR